MLTKRIIPCLDIDRGRVVKGISFVDLRDAGDPAEMAALYDREGADELVFLDITASSDQRGIMEEVVRRVSEELFIPLTVGGGLRSVQDIRRMLEAGADKASLNTAAVQDPSLVEEAASRPAREKGRWWRVPWGWESRRGGRCTPTAAASPRGWTPWPGPAT